MASVIRLLYVDDEPSLLDIGKLFLEESGNFSVTTAESATAALDLLKTEPFDVIVSDYQMPGMDGIRFLIEVRKEFGHIPFILFTGRGREEIVIQAINSGADFYLQKGGDPGSQFAELSHKVRAAVSQRTNELAFKESEERFRAISEYSHTAICIIDERAKIIWANDKMQELGGYSPAQLYRTESFVGFIAPESVEFVVSNFSRVLAGEPYEHHYSFYFIRADGEKRLCEKHMMDVVDSHGRRNLIISMLDVTDRRVAEENLRQRNDAMEAAIDGLAILNAEQNYTYMNKAHAAIYGYDNASELIGTSWRGLYDPNELQRIERDVMPEIGRIGHYRGRAIGRKKDKSTFPQEISLTTLKNGGLICVVRDITERKLAEEQLNESEERYLSLFDRSLDCIYIHDLEGNFIDANPASLALLGYNREDISTISFMSLIGRDQLYKAVESIKTIVETGTQTNLVQFRLQTKTGEFVEVETKGSLILHNKKPYAVFGIARNITDRKQAEAALQRQSVTLSILNNIISTANKADSLPQLFISILSESLRLLDFDAGGIYLVDRSTRTANIVHSQNLPTEFLAEIQTVSIDKKPYDALFIKNESFITDNYAKINPVFSKKYEFQSMASIPLLSKGVAIGALNVTSKRRQVISEEEKQTLFSIGRELGSTIERMAAEEEGKKAAKNLETLFNSIEEMVFVLDMQGRILVVNDTVLKSLSYTSEELTGMDVLQLHVPEQRDEALRNVQGMIAGTIDSCPVPVLAKDGTRIEAETKVTRGWWNGSEVLIGVTRDITDRKHAEEIRTRFGRILESSLNEIYFFDAQTLMFVDVNHGARENIGYTIDELRTMTPLDITTEYTKESFETLLSPLRTGEKDIQVFFTVNKRKDGSLYPVEVHIQLAGNEVSPVFVSIILDITERRQTEEALRLANWKLNLLSGITRHDINNQMTVLRGYINLLEMKQTDPALNEYIQKMDASAQRISSMIQFTKEYDEIGITLPVWQDICTLVTNAAEEVSFGKIQLKNDLPAGMEIFSEPLIFKVFYNLMDNAVRYGETITTIRFSVEKRSGDRILVCEDDGVGVPYEDKEKIFLRGFGKNTGLGLALSQEILEITGISIEETGEPGIGARFEMTVPKGMWRMAKKGA